MAEKSDNTKETNIKSTIEAVKGLAEAVPVYNDVVQPAAKEIGKSLATVAKTVNIALAPVSALVWGYEKIKDFVLARVSEKLKDVPEEKIITPDPAIVGPSLEALRYTGNDLNLRELYASLIATAMNAYNTEMAHPGFIEIIKNLSSDEAILLKYFHTKRAVHPLADILALLPNSSRFSVLKRNVSILGKEVGLVKPHLTPNYITNICRLGLMEIVSGWNSTNDNVYKLLFEDLDEVKEYKSIYNLHGDIVTLDKKTIAITDFGRQFCNACIGINTIYIQL